jgi:hypothetical protein
MRNQIEALSYYVVLDGLSKIQKNFRGEIEKRNALFFL